MAKKNFLEKILNPFGKDEEENGKDEERPKNNGKNNDKNGKKNGNGKKKSGIFVKFFRFFAIGFLFLYLLAVFGSNFSGNGSQQAANEIPLSQALEKIKNNETKEITVIENRVQLKLKDDSLVFSQKEPTANFTEILKDSDIDPTTVNFRINNQDVFKIFADLITTFAPIILTAVIFIYIFKQAGKAQNSLFAFGKSKAKMFRKNNKATFADVAGLKEAKEEVVEVVDFLKNPDKYRKMGARTPKGVLLVGPSGTGKTLLARAISGEAKVPFFHMAGSEFMEMLVGVGASRVRDLFQIARKSGKAIIFIDEIDAIGAVRGFGLAAGHSEREQTLNQLLVEMDGLEPNETIVIVAATNRPDILDPALIRPGRFDRRIALTLPDLPEREQILALHAKNKPFDKGVSWEKVAKRTVSFSGADLENMLNEAAILAARKSKTTISTEEIDEAALKMKLGPEKKRMISDEDKKITAYHEAGHAVVSFFLPKTDPVERISIISRGLALGYTLIPPETDRVHENKTHLLSQIAVLMGGRAAEEMIFDEMTSGAAADIQTATQIARHMVVDYGMSELGPIYFGPQIDVADWGQSFFQPQEISQDARSLVDKEIKKIIGASYQKAKDILKRHRKKLDKITARLLEKETLEREEFERIIKGKYLISNI